MRDENSVFPTLTSWTEGKSSLHSHQQGAVTLTLNQIYDTAKNNWIKADQSKNDVYFDSKHKGLVSQRGYSPHGCMDDCFFTVKITEIKAGSFTEN